MLTTNLKGEIACAAFEKRAMEKGYVVCRPLSDAIFDRIVEMDGAFKRVQIKYADGKAKDGSRDAVWANLRHRNGKCLQRYDALKIDAVVIFVPATNKVYWFNAVDVCEKTRITMRLSPAKNGQQTNVSLASDFEW